jgi:hypothetical protein
MKVRAFNLIDHLREFVTKPRGLRLTQGKLPRHVAEERRIARGEPVDRNATTLLRSRH